MDRDDIAMLDSEVVSYYTVYASGTIIKIIVCQNNENSVLSLLALDQDCVAAEELQRLHGVVRKGDDGVVIVGCVRYAIAAVSELLRSGERRIHTSASLASSSFSRWQWPSHRPGAN
jgi:hypothetical protein